MNKQIEKYIELFDKFRYQEGDDEETRVKKAMKEFVYYDKIREAWRYCLENFDQISEEDFDKLWKGMKFYAWMLYDLVKFVKGGSDGNGS